MSPSLKALAAAATAAAALGLGASTASAAVPPFYVPPTSLPAQNGSIVRSQPQPLGVSIVIAGQAVYLPAKATKIMYKSVDEIGQPAAVTGVYLEPTKAWTGGGPRPLVAYAEGTQGQGDACAPSRTLENTVVLESGQTALGYEVPSIYSLLDKGIAVVVTDYIGLGTPDRVHSYTDRLDMGHAVLDAARAALQVDGASVTSSSPVGIYGYSQGGGAAASAAELQPSYAPDVNLKGAYAGAPPADLSKVMISADGTSLTGVIGYAVNGIVQYHPELKATLDAQTNAAGKAALWRVANQCVGDTILSYGFKKTSEWTTSKKTVAQVIAGIPEAIQAVADQRIGKLKPEVPVQVLTGTMDDIVAHGQAKQLARDWCALGANVYYAPVRQYIGSGGTALNHLGPMLTSMSATQAWLVARLRGVPQTSHCGAPTPRPPPPPRRAARARSSRAAGGGGGRARGVVGSAAPAGNIPCVKRDPVTVTVASTTVVRVLLVAAATGIALTVLWELRGPIVWVLIAALIATALDRPVERLARRMPRALAILLVYIVLVLIPVTLLLLTVPPLVAEAQRLIESLPSLITSAQDAIQGNGKIASLLRDFDPLDTLKAQAAQIPARLTDVASIVGSIGLGALNSIVATLTVLILSVFFVSGGGRAIRQGIDLWGGDRAVLLHRVVDRTGTAIAAYFAGTLTVALVAGFTAYAAMSILGIPYAVALSVLCGVASLVPMFGATIAAVLVGIIAAITTSWTVVLAWAIWEFAYQQIENNLIQPQIQKRTVKVPPVLTVIGVLFGSSLLGILGAIIAIPAIAAVLAIAEEWSAWTRGRASVTGGEHFRVALRTQATAEAVEED